MLWLPALLQAQGAGTWRHEKAAQAALAHWRVLRGAGWRISCNLAGGMRFLTPPFVAF